MADRPLSQLVAANVLADPDLLYLARGTTPLKLPAATAATFFTEKATATLDAAKRLVPAQPAANVRSSVFLRGDGVWATPPASPSGPGGGVAPTAANLSAILSQAPPDGIAGIAYSWLPKIPQDGVTGLPDSLNTLTGGVAANLDSINALMNNARATLTQAERDWRAGLVESHIPGAIVYQPPYLDLVRWHPATAGNAGLSLDVTGKSVANFGGRRGITGLGQQDDKVVFVKLDSYPTSGHFGYIRPPSGGGQVFLGVDANNNNAYQIYDPDELSPAVRTLSDASAATISWVAGDVFGFSAQAYGSTLTIVPVVFRAGGGKVQANDVAFNSANAVTHYDASSFIIQNGSSVGDVWVARHSGLGIRHSDIAHADFSDIAGTPGLGLRREGEGSDVLTQTRVVNYSAGLQSQGESVARVVDIEQWARADDVSPIPMAKLINAGASVTYPIEAYVRVAHGANVSSLSLTSGGVWSDSAQKFTTKPAASSGAVFDQSDLPADATSSGTYDYIRFRRIHREGESAVPGNAWFRLGKLDDDSAGSTGSVAAATTAALGTVFLANALSDVRSSAVPTAAQVTAALAGKAATAHSHTIANVDGLQNALDARVLTSVYTSGQAAKQDKLPDGTDEQVLTWSGGAWTAADAAGGGIAISNRIDVAANLRAGTGVIVDGTPVAPIYDFDLTNAVMLLARVTGIGGQFRYGAIAAQRTSDGEWVELANDLNNNIAVRDDGFTLSYNPAYENFYAVMKTGGQEASPRFTALDDTPDALGTAGQLVAVNAGRNGLTFIDQPSGGADGVALIYADAPIPDGGILGVVAWADIPQGGKLVAEGRAIAFTGRLNGGVVDLASPTLEQIRAANSGTSRAGQYSLYENPSQTNPDCFCVREKPGVAGQLQFSAQNAGGSATVNQMRLDTMRFLASAAGEAVATDKQATDNAAAAAAAQAKADEAAAAAAAAGGITEDDVLAFNDGSSATERGNRRSFQLPADYTDYVNVVLAVGKDTDPANRYSTRVIPVSDLKQNVTGIRWYGAVNAGTWTLATRTFITGSTTDFFRSIKLQK